MLINDFLIKIDSFPWDVIKNTTPQYLTNELGLIHTTFVLDSIKWQMGKYDLLQHGGNHLGFFNRGLQVAPGVGGGAGHAGGVRQNLSVISVRGLDGPGSQLAYAAGDRQVLVHFWLRGWV